MSRLTRQVFPEGDEEDAFTTWRRVMHWQRGELRRIKRRANKRDRRNAKSRIARGEEG